MVVNVVLDLSPSAKYFAPSSPIVIILPKSMVVSVVLDLSPSAKYFAPSAPIIMFQIDGCQRGVGLESFGQILCPFGANVHSPN